ncbi:MAG TPA: Crp/Fnr family transcriptional regulator [Candidatus Angelobacter sp.]|jgi:CRP/FNR family transcriptional regulator|nr:Crp/Fnr family transcriptional regulator [Candidatus Angelobacter sp.]
MQMANLNAPQDTLLNRANQAGQVFCNLPSEASSRFNAMGMEMGFGSGSMLFTEGEVPRQVFILRSGRVKLSVTSREGKTMIVRIAEAGQVLGLNAVLTAGEYEVSAQALEPCRVTAIHIKDFLAFLQEYPEAAMESTRCVLREYQAVFSDVRRLALPATVAGRLANLLLDWLKTRGQGNVMPRFIMALTQEEIAGMTGTSRETVSRVLHRFQREKLISIKGTSLTVLRPEVLEQLAV